MMEPQDNPREDWTPAQHRADAEYRARLAADPALLGWDEPVNVVPLTPEEADRIAALLPGMLAALAAVA